MKIITRFAPSPTGMLHLGGARTALFNYLFAKANNGEFKLRIEDTDLERSTKEAEEDIIDGLNWLGLKHDGEIIHQSQRQEKYREIANKLLESGNAYKCYCTKEELEKIAHEQKINNQNLSYNGNCRKYLNEELPEEIKNRPFVVRVKFPREGFTSINDLVQKKVSWENNTIEDFVILRPNGNTTYMLSVVVDDYEMDINHIIRGDDHLINTPKQIFIYQSMGWNIPQFAHIPLIHGPDGTKLSKRHGAVSLTSYRDMGFLPEAMNNALLRLGWAHGNDEIITINQAIEWFSIEKINKGAAKFDLQKLNALNKHYIKNTPNDLLIKLITEFLEKDFQRKLNNTEIKRINHSINEVKIRCKTTKEIADMISFIKDDNLPNISLIQPNINNQLTQIYNHLSKLKEWNNESIKHCINQIKETLNINLSEISKIIRIVIAKSEISIGIYDILLCIGRSDCLLRIKNYANY